MRYRNISDQDLVLIGVGEIKAGETIETDQIIENPNFKAEGVQTVSEQPVQVKQEQPMSEKKETDLNG